MSFVRVAVLMGVAALASGCHLFSKLTPDCHTPQEYERAGQVAPLKVPAGMDSPNTQGALVIPTVGVVPPRPGPHDTCLDIPPRYVPAPASRAASEPVPVPPPPPPPAVPDPAAGSAPP
jgi:uncharacterized lipoprotein